MQHGGEGALPGFFFENARGIGIGFARMNDERQPGLARCRDVGAKAALLRVARAIVVVIVEARFAQRDDLRMPCVRHEIGCGDLEFLVGVVRMRADRAIDVGKAFGDSQHIGEPMYARRDRDHARNPGRASAHDNVVKLVGKIRKIQMAMAVDQHGYCAAGASAST